MGSHSHSCCFFYKNRDRYDVFVAHLQCRSLCCVYCPLSRHLNVCPNERKQQARLSWGYRSAIPHPRYSITSCNVIVKLTFSFLFVDWSMAAFPPHDFYSSFTHWTVHLSRERSRATVDTVRHEQTVSWRLKKTRSRDWHIKEAVRALFTRAS